MDKLNKLSKLEIVLYDCPKYKIDNNHHQGLFGTIIRFFPMFDFPNNDANIVILSDIDDFGFKKYFTIFNILENKLNNLYLIKFSNAGRMFKCKEQFNHIYKDIILDYIKPQEMVCLKQIDHIVIIDFLQNLNDNIKYSYYLNDNIIKDNKYISKYVNNGFFIYGIDEYFLNNHYLKFIIDKKLSFVNILKFNIYNYLYYQVFIRNERWIENNKQLFNKLLNRILKFMNINYIKYNTEEDKFKIISDKIDNDINLKIRLYKIFIKYKTNPKYKFLFNTIYNNLLLSDKYFGMYEFTEYKFYNNNYNDFFEKQLKFTEKDINKLKN
jgi:hypothetical protein